ncbi:hypothetical protein QTP88_010641 [Uroleucon formosanum]
MNRLNACGKKKPSGCYNRKKAKESAQKNASIIAKIPKLINYFTIQGATKVTSESELLKTENSVDDPPPVSCESSVVDVSVIPSLVSDDPALWTTNEDIINHVIEHGFKQNLQNSQFPESKRIIPGTSSRFRYLSLSLFQRTLLNGELGNREYLSYSVTTGSVYCVPCRLFGNQVPIAQEGWSDWKHPERVTDHENTNDHKNCVLTMIERNRKKGKIDSELIASLEFEKKYWRNVLTRVVAIVVSLTSRGLPMRGHNECFGSLHNGNFMRELELIAQFDPFLSKHIAQYRNSGRGKVSYLSSTTYYEVIHIMKNKIMKTIINEVKNAKYFSIVVDSTPDISHTDQISLIYRYVLNGIPVERFIQFIPNTGHKSKEIADAVLKAIHEHGLDIKNCRGQSYDNASNMSGKYSGLQARIKEVSPLAEYAPCSAHSLNLVGQCAADSSQESTAFFCLMQNIYVFFSSSTSRWTTFISHTSTNITLKRKSDTRWSARYDMCFSLLKNWDSIITSLINIRDSTSEKAITKNEAKGLFLHLNKLETAILVLFWGDVLERFNLINKKLQFISIDLITVSNLYSSLINYVKQLRSTSMFEQYEKKALLLSNVKKYDENRKKKRKLAHDETRKNEIVQDSRTKFRVNTYIEIVDRLTSELKKRKIAYDEINNNFGFLFNLTKLNSVELTNCADLLHKKYTNDLPSSFANECIHFKGYLISKLKTESMTILEMQQFIIENKVQEVFPYIEIATRMFLSIPASNCSAERSFSALKRIKNYLRSKLTHWRRKTRLTSSYYYN